MREIKFKGRRVDNGEWVYGYLMNMYSNRLFIGEWRSIGVEATVKDELFVSYDEVDPATVGQYTGLKDKNGVEVYEGDVVKSFWTEESGTVFLEEYVPEESLGVTKVGFHAMNCGLGLGDDGKPWMTIIGNIHQENGEK